MRLIESYDIEDIGYHPVLVKDSWQVAKLNYVDHYQIDHLKCLVKHQRSDRAISLLTGNALLIISDNLEISEFNTVVLKRSSSYNIPKNVWYNIVMREGCQLFIVERPNTHIDDVSEYLLSEKQLISIRKEVNHVIIK